MTASHSILFEATQIAGLKIRNKLAVAPMTRVSAREDGKVGALMQAYYENYARGGFGLLISEGLYTDEQYSQCYFKQPGIASQRQADSWRPIVDGVHAQGAVIVAQLMHAGALSQHNRFSDKTVAPSAVRPKGQQMPLYHGDGLYPVPAALTEKQIQDVIQGFAASALRAKSVGFDGVEIHGANGYLLDQFLTCYSNHRQDNYGGELSSRLRIYAEIISAVRQSVGDDFVIGVRFSQKKVNDAQYLWPEGESAAEQVFGLMKQCKVDYIHTTEPALADPAFEGSASLSSLAKKYSGLPVIANGGISRPEVACEALENGQADLVALGRVALSNQDWPKRVTDGAPITDFDGAMFSPKADLQSAECFFNEMSKA